LRSDVDLRAGRLMIHRSRTLNEDNATKTSASERTIELVDQVVAALRDAKPLQATDQTFVFTNTEGHPIFVDNFGTVWHPVLRAVGVRPRKFYATRHTFISLALTRGAKVKWLAEYCGTSVAMITGARIEHRVCLGNFQHEPDLTSSRTGPGSR
jgi:integrase